MIDVILNVIAQSSHKMKGKLFVSHNSDENLFESVVLEFSFCYNSLVFQELLFNLQDQVVGPIYQSFQ